MQTNNAGVETLHQTELTTIAGGSNRLPYITSNNPVRVDDGKADGFIPVLRIDPAVCPFPSF